MDAIFNEILTILLKALISVILALIGAGAREFTKYMKAKVASERAAAAFAELDTIVQDGIDFIEQTIVRKYKASSKWDEDTQREALAECARYINDCLSDRAAEVIKESRADIGELILEKIESALGRAHRE